MVAGFQNLFPNALIGSPRLIEESLNQDPQGTATSLTMKDLASLGITWTAYSVFLDL